MLVDTNGLMVPGQYGIDVFEELRRLGYDEFLCALGRERRARIAEAKSQREGPHGALIANGLLSGCEIIEAPGSADDVLIMLGKR